VFRYPIEWQRQKKLLQKLGSLQQKTMELLSVSEENDFMSLVEQHKQIRTREDFLTFVKALNKDLRDHPDTWENKSLDRFLEALGAWIEDMDGYYINQGKPVPRQLDWKVIGDMLMGAKMYE
jgi:hypothetical protein